MDEVQRIPYPWQKLLFLRRFSGSCLGVGTPPAAWHRVSDHYTAVLTSLLKDQHHDPRPLLMSRLNTIQNLILSTGRYLPSMGAFHARVMNRIYKRAQEVANTRLCINDFDAPHFRTGWFKPDRGFELRK